MVGDNNGFSNLNALIYLRHDSVFYGTEYPEVFILKIKTDNDWYSLSALLGTQLVTQTINIKHCLGYPIIMDMSNGINSN